MATECKGSKCEIGGDGTCCFECAKREGCTDAWKCEYPAFYASCKAEGGGGVVEVDMATRVKTG